MSTECKVKFYLVRVWGDLMADRNDDQYTEKIICGDCLDELRRSEDERDHFFEVIDTSDYDDVPWNPCEFRVAECCDCN